MTVALSGILRSPSALKRDFVLIASQRYTNETESLSDK
jgi:hypothetical protein